MTGTRKTRDPVTGDLVARDMRVALVAGRFNELIVEGLVSGAMDTLKRHGALEADVEIYQERATEIDRGARDAHHTPASEQRVSG